MTKYELAADFGASFPGSVQVITDFCVQQVPFWHQHVISHNNSIIHYKRLTGGLTNQLFVATLKCNKCCVNKHDCAYVQQQKSEQVLVRIYGDAPCVNRRKAEHVAIVLGQEGLTPSIIAQFDGGCIEEFIYGKTLQQTHFQDSVVIIALAKKLARVHCVKMKMLDSSSAATNTIQSSFIFQSLDEWQTQAIDRMQSVNKKLRSRRRWFACACNRDTDSNKTNASYEIKEMIVLPFGIGELRKEIEWLKVQISQMNDTIVFCHNDLNPGNVIMQTKDYNKSSGKNNDNGNQEGLILHAIDFEYADYNPRSFDIANCMCEAYLDQGYEKYPFFQMIDADAPTDERKRLFIANYLDAFNLNKPSASTVAALSSVASPVEVLDKPATTLIATGDDIAQLESNVGQPSNKDEVEMLLKNVNLMMMASHMMWSLWAISHCQSGLPFGYIEYAQTRLAEYKKLKLKLKRA